VLYSNSFKIGLAKSYHKDIIYRGKKDIVSLRTRWQFGIFMIAANELLDVTAYGLRSDFLSPETMPKATVELALTKNRKLLLASVLGAGHFYLNLYPNVKLISNVR